MFDLSHPRVRNTRELRTSTQLVNPNASVNLNTSCDPHRLVICLANYRSPYPCRITAGLKRLTFTSYLLQALRVAVALLLARGTVGTGAALLPCRNATKACARHALGVEVVHLLALKPVTTWRESTATLLIVAARCGVLAFRVLWSHLDALCAKDAAEAVLVQWDVFRLTALRIRLAVGDAAVPFPAPRVATVSFATALLVVAVGCGSCRACKETCRRERGSRCRGASLPKLQQCMMPWCSWRGVSWGCKCLNAASTLSRRSPRGDLLHPLLRYWMFDTNSAFPV